MPKVSYTNTKGLYQEAGSGINLSKGATAHRRKIVAVQTTPLSLTAADSGTDYALIVGSDLATTINLPAGSTCSVGTMFSFGVGMANTNGYKILRGTNITDVIIGGYTIYSAESGSPGGDNQSVTCISAGSGGSRSDTVTLTGGSVNNVAGDVGSRVHFLWDGTQWRTWGTLFTLDTSITAGNTVFSDTD